jgi:hypothetical protein
VLDLPRWAGRAAAVPLGALAHRRHGKPMHLRGVVVDAVLERCGPVADGVPWPGTGEAQSVVVRLSRGAGLPAVLPDLLGLAIRFPDGPVDVLLSSTGRGPLGRRLTVPRRDAAATYSSIMGYRSPAGTLLLAALPGAGTGPLPSDPGPLADAVVQRRPAFTLAVARGTGPWRPFARLRLLGPVDAFDPDVRFDAVRNPPPGLVPDGPMARFRAPAYTAARRERSRAGQPPEDAHAPPRGTGS